MTLQRIYVSVLLFFCACVYLPFCQWPSKSVNVLCRAFNQNLIFYFMIHSKMAGIARKTVKWCGKLLKIFCLAKMKNDFLLLQFRWGKSENCDSFAVSLFGLVYGDWQRIWSSWRVEKKLMWQYYRSVPCQVSFEGESRENFQENIFSNIFSKICPGRKNLYSAHCSHHLWLIGNLSKISYNIS